MFMSIPPLPPIRPKFDSETSSQYREYLERHKEAFESRSRSIDIDMSVMMTFAVVMLTMGVGFASVVIYSDAGMKGIGVVIAIIAAIIAAFIAAQQIIYRIIKSD